MFKDQDAYRRRVRRAFEKRLGRALSEMEFEKLLRIGHGIFWDYDPYGHIDPYDPATLRANARALNTHEAPQTASAGR